MGIIQQFKEWRERRNEKWHIIDNHHELSIGQYVDIIAIGKDSGELIDKSTAVLKVLTGWSEADIEGLPLSTYSALASGCGWLYEPIPPREVQRDYRVGDYLLRRTNADELTTAQYIDFQAYVKDTDKYIVELLSVLLVPYDKKYGVGYSVTDVQKHIRRYLPTDDAVMLVAFFLKQSEALISSTLHSLEEEVRNAPTKTKEQKETIAKAMAIISAVNGDGSPTLNS